MSIPEKSFPGAKYTGPGTAASVAHLRNRKKPMYLK